MNDVDNGRLRSVIHFCDEVARGALRLHGESFLLIGPPDHLPRCLRSGDGEGECLLQIEHERSVLGLFRWTGGTEVLHRLCSILNAIGKE